MFPNSNNIQGSGTAQFGCMPNQMQAQNPPNMIRCQGQTPGFCQPQVPNCDCRVMPASNYMQPNGMNPGMMNGCQGIMPPNFTRPTPNQPCPQNQNQQQQQQRMMQQMFGMQQQPQQAGNNQFGQNVCPNMQRNMNHNAMPQQQPFNMGFNSY